MRKGAYHIIFVPFCSAKDGQGPSGFTGGGAGPTSALKPGDKLPLSSGSEESTVARLLVQPATSSLLLRPLLGRPRAGEASRLGSGDSCSVGSLFEDAEMAVTRGALCVVDVSLLSTLKPPVPEQGAASAMVADTL